MLVKRHELRDTSRGFSEWSLGDEEAQPFLQQAIELGITFWDTANVYRIDSSKEIVGRALKKYASRRSLFSTDWFPMMPFDAAALGDRMCTPIAAGRKDNGAVTAAPC
jgi:predicted aldo/keto reductase-like oxidoreductase